MPAAGPDVIYVIYLPPNSVSTLDLNESDEAYHWTTVTSNGTINYAVIDHRNFSTDERLTVFGSHEIFETATDVTGDATTGSGWLLVNSTTKDRREIADPCNIYVSDMPFTAGHRVAPVWSKSACRCVPPT